MRDVKDCYWSATVDSTGATITNDQSAVVPGPLRSASLFVDYIYLDTDERRRFAQVSHEYLIEQLQFTGEESTSSVATKIKLNFNHPCKELIWVVQKDAFLADSVSYGKQWFNYTDAVDTTYSTSGAFGSAVDLVTPSTAVDGDAGSMPGVAAGGANNVFIPVSFENGKNPVALAKLQLNGHDRFSERDGQPKFGHLKRKGQYFSLVPLHIWRVQHYLMRETLLNHQKVFSYHLRV
jgi:hypothetical protein